MGKRFFLADRIKGLIQFAGDRIRFERKSRIRNFIFDTLRKRCHLLAITVRVELKPASVQRRQCSP